VALPGKDNDIVITDPGKSEKEREGSHDSKKPPREE
jgi:hypothetical protein